MCVCVCVCVCVRALDICVCLTGCFFNLYDYDLCWSLAQVRPANRLS